MAPTTAPTTEPGRSPSSSAPGRELDHERRDRSIGESDRAAVAFDDVAGDRQAEAGAAGVTGAGFVQPGEALEDCARSSAGIPAPSSPTVRRACPSVSARVNVTVVAACRSALSSRLRTARASWLGIAADVRGRDAGGVDDDLSALDEPARLAEHDVVEVDGLHRRTGRRGVAPRQVEQVVDEVLEVDRLVEHAALGRHRVGGRSGRRGRPRARCACGSAGCAARARRRRRSAAGAAPRPRPGRASRSWSGRADRSRRRCPARGPGGRGWPPVISAISARIVSTGRSVRPISHQVSTPSTRQDSRHGDRQEASSGSAPVVTSSSIDADEQLRPARRRSRRRGSGPGTVSRASRDRTSIGV